MFTPSAADVRRFFCMVYAKRHRKTILDGLELVAEQWIEEHPEYHQTLGSLAQAIADGADDEAILHARAEPQLFLHLSMHLSIHEQYSIDQPRGIRQAIDLLKIRLGSLHAAHHEVIPFLADMIAQSQKTGVAPDGEVYVEAIQRRATRG